MASRFTRVVAIHMNMVSLPRTKASPRSLSSSAEICNGARKPAFPTAHRHGFGGDTLALAFRNFSSVPASQLEDEGSDSSVDDSSSVKITISRADRANPSHIIDETPFVHANAESMELVDRLLLRTSEMMDPSAANVVAYSGGVDSSLVAALVYRSFSNYNMDGNSQNTIHDNNNNDDTFSRGTAQAVLGISPAVPQTQIQMAREVAEVIGIPLMEVTTAEGSDEEYVKNDGHACYVCKTHLYSTLESVANHIMKMQQQKRNSNETSNSNNKHSSVILYNGTNADDTQDPTRLGLIAASNFHVASPLDQITKDEVRQAAKYLGLPNWNAAASPCLRSRLAMGVSATEEHLKAVERAEDFVREKLGLDVTKNVRVRMLAGGKAMVELDEDVIVKDYDNSAFGGSGNIKWVENILREDGFELRCVEEWGFKSFGGVRSFKTGSVAAMPAKTNLKLKTTM